MQIAEISILFIIAILGMAYPISIQVVSQLDEKYKSVNILDLFEEESIGKFFTWSLYGALAYILLYAFRRMGLVTFEVGPTCKNMVEDGLIFVAAILIISFLSYVNLIFSYYSPYRLYEYLRKNRDDKNFSYFRAIADIYYLSIRLHDNRLATTIHNYLYQRFKNIRSASDGSPVVYPIIFYEMTHNSLIEFCELKSNKMTYIGKNIASGHFLLGEHEYSHVSEATYNWLWHNLRLISETKNDKLAFEYWKNSHQLISSAFPRINFKYSSTNTLEVENREEIDQREKERDKFYEFHFALGGMLNII